MTTWNPLDFPIDRCVIGGYPTPGLCEVFGASSARKWDEQAGYAMTGAILIFRGIAPSHFSLVFRLFTTEHWQQWAEIRPILLKPPIGKSQAIEGGGVGIVASRALDIDHPVLNEVGITHLVVEDVAAPEQTEDGVWTITVKCIEWRRFGVSIGKPDGAQQEPDELAGRLAVLEKLNDEAQMKRAALDEGNP